MVVVASPSSQAARAYVRRGQRFAPGDDASTKGAMPTTLVDSNGDTWQVTEEYLVRTSGLSLKLERLPSHMSFWFGWFQFHPDTEVYTPDAPE